MTASGGSPLPVSVITGFLGSGKTTLLNHILSEPEMADTAVIINEFGEISLDHLLVETSIENTVVLQSGCICCTVRGDLVDTLIDLLNKRQQGLVPAFSRVLIETTGIADPAPILHTLVNNDLVRPLFVIQSVVATVDTVNVLDQLDGFPEAVKQVALADVLALTKADLANAALVGRIRERLHQINPSASYIEVLNGRVSSHSLFQHTYASPAARPERLAEWLAIDKYAADGPGLAAASRHNDGIRALSIVLDQPIPQAGLEAWLASLLSLRGKDLLRMKGIVNVADQPGPSIVHAVQHILHPMTRLPRWPDADRRTRITLIARDIPLLALRNSLYLHLAPER